MSQITLKRESLYNEVWTEPMSKLAPRYGLSDKGFAKICDKMDIPIPYRGYWAKKSAGKNPPQTPLPTPKSETLTEYNVDSYSIVSNPSTGDILNASDIDLDFIRNIKVENSYSEYHQLVETARDYFLSAKATNDSPILKASGNILEIEVSKENLGRALRIVEAILRGVEEMGGTVQLGKHRYNDIHICSYAIIQGERLAFSVKEQVGQVKHVPTDEELKRMKKNEYYHPPSFDNVPSNKFEVTIETWTNKTGIQRKWIDTPEKSLDNRIGAFLIGLLKTAPIVRQERIEYEERQRKEQEEKDRIRIEREKKDAEHKRIAALNSHLKMSAKVESIDKYLNNLQNLLKNEKISEDRKKDINHWIEWVKNYRDKIDPMNPKNLLYENWVPEELFPKQEPQENKGYNLWTQPEQKKERSFGWWNRPPWKW